MRKTMSRLTRAAATTAAIVLVASGAAVAWAPAASAATCDQVTGWLCGAVKNRTGRTMHITTNLRENQGDGTNGWCDVWNWGGDPTYSFKHAACRQEEWGNGTKGGNGSGVDVDAFTFNGEGYHERFGRLGKWHWREKGIWTKIWDGWAADCGIGDSNEIWCTVGVQAP